MKHKFTTAIFSAGVLAASGALADSKTFSWADPNLVPCEGIGATGSGRIELHITYTIAGDKLTVTQMNVTGTYLHTIDLTGSVKFTKPDGSGGRVNLQKPWFSSIVADPATTKSLHLPRRNNGNLATDQTPFEARNGANLELSVGTLFPQTGGNCASTFDQTFKVP
jgi:hypothetical protein